MSQDKIFRKEVLEAPAYHLEAHEGVKLDQNEYPLDIPVTLKAEIIEQFLKTPWNRYPLTDPVLLQKKMAKQLDVWPDNLVFANGSNVLIQALIIASALGKKIMVLDPTFSVYEIQGKMLGSKIIRVPLNENDFSLPVDECLKTIQKEKPQIIFIANPNAPTGNLFDSEGLKKIVKAAPGLVVIDEAYFPFSQLTLASWMKEFDHLVILRTFSKAYALGGLRLGYLMAEPEVAYQVNKCLLPFCISKLTYVTALTLLDQPNYIQDHVKAILSERARVYKNMETISEIKAYPTSTNFILFEPKNKPELFEKLIKEKVVVRKISDGRRFKDALRVTIGTKEENDTFLIALKKALS